MTRSLLVILALALASAAADLPDISLATAAWTPTAGVTIEAGVASLSGDPAAYRRATLTLPGEGLAGRTIRFSAQVLTQGLAQGKDIAYASPKLKVINAATQAVMAVNNFGVQEHPAWTPVAVEVTVPKGHTAPVILEIGLQLCTGLFKAREASLAEVQPWRWRVLDGGQKSTFDK